MLHLSEQWKSNRNTCPSPLRVSDQGARDVLHFVSKDIAVGSTEYRVTNNDAGECFK